MAVIVTVDGHPNGTIPSERRIDLEYFKSPPGILKIAQFILGIVLIALGSPIWLRIVVYICFIVTLTLIWFYFFGIQGKYETPVPWNVMEFYYTAIATVAYGIASILSFLTLYVFSSVLGLLTTAAYAGGTLFLAKDWKQWKGQNAATHQMHGPGP